MNFYLSLWMSLIKNKKFVYIVKVIKKFYLTNFIKMKKTSAKEIVVPEKGGTNAELVQDEVLMKNGNSISLGAFTDWSWNLVRRKGYAWKFFIIYLIMFWIGFVMSFLDSCLTVMCWLNDSGVSLSIFSDIADIVLAAWLLWFSINVAKWLVQEVKDFFHEITRDRSWKILCISIIMWVIIVLCCIPLIISATLKFEVNVILIIIWIILLLFWIFVGVRLKFAQYVVVDKWYWPREALIYSRNITKWRFWEIVWFDCYYVLINLLWMLCLLVWLIRTSAMTYISVARYYRLISNIYDKNLS